MPYLPPSFKPTGTREFYLQPTQTALEPYEVIFTATSLEYNNAPMGYLLHVNIQGRRQEIGWRYQGTIPELEAYTWLCSYKLPEAPKPPRRGLLWHFYSAAQRWFQEGY